MSHESAATIAQPAEDISDKAGEFYRIHAMDAESRDRTQERLSVARPVGKAIMEQVQIISDSNSSADKFAGVNEKGGHKTTIDVVRDRGMDILADTAEDAHSEWLSAESAAKSASNSLKANEWEAHKHYQTHQEAYVETAIADANAAGHDVTVDGVQHSANS